MAIYMINKPFIKLFKVASGFFIYDINTNRVLKINQPLYNALLEILKTGKTNEKVFSDDVEQDLLSLEDEGYLKDNPIQKIISPYYCVFKSYLHGKMNSLTLEVTQKCNFCCKYCDYSSDEFFNRNHTTKSMSIEIAKKAIDMYFKNSIYENSKSFGFYGGEPLLAYQFIKECVEYIKSKCDGNEIIYHMTTNASLLNEEMIHFFSEYGFIITISLDGPKDYHNKNRKFSSSYSETFDIVYDKIKMINELKNKYPLHVKINAVWDGSLPKKELEDFFLNDPIISNYSFLINDMSSNDLNNYFAIEEDDILIDKNNQLKNILTRRFQHKNVFTENEENKYLLEKLKNHYNLPKNFHHAGMCIAGQKNIYVTADGNLFPCEKFSIICTYAQIGTVWESLNYDKILQLLNFGEITQEECKHCWAIRLCSMCALTANGRDTLSREVKLTYCTQQKQKILEDLKNITSLIMIDKTFSK